MFDKLLEILKAIWNDLMPYYIVTEMELSCVLRFGKFRRVSGPGVHAKIPFAEVPYTYHVKTCTAHLTAQTLTTADIKPKTIVVKAIVRYHIFDIKSYVTKVWDAQDAINDTIQGIIGDIIKNSTWDAIVEGIEDAITAKAAAMLEEWGIRIERVTLSDLAEIRTYRLIQA